MAGMGLAPEHGLDPAGRMTGRSAVPGMTWPGLPSPSDMTPRIPGRMPEPERRDIGCAGAAKNTRPTIVARWIKQPLPTSETAASQPKKEVRT
jgi:hypothetical protein